MLGCAGLWGVWKQTNNNRSFTIIFRILWFVGQAAQCQTPLTKLQIDGFGNQSRNSESLFLLWASLGLPHNLTTMEAMRINVHSMANTLLAPLAIRMQLHSHRKSTLCSANVVYWNTLLRCTDWELFGLPQILICVIIGRRDLGGTTELQNWWHCHGRDRTR